MLIKSDAKNFLNQFESDLKYYSTNLPSKCYIEKHKVMLPPTNIIEILDAINKLDFQPSFENSYYEEKAKEELNNLIPGIAKLMFENGNEFGEDAVIVLDQSFAIELSIWGEHLLYGDPYVYMNITGIIAKEDTRLEDIDKHFELLKKIEEID